MQVSILSIGRWKAGSAKALFEDYRQRLTWPVTLIELEEKRKLPPAQLRQAEAALLRAALPKDRAGSAIIVLDEGGKALASADFARRIGTWRDDGRRHLVCLIGGADGHEPALKREGDLLLSLGAMTWPHLLVRGLILEQIYRAQQILAGHPYHRA